MQENYKILVVDDDMRLRALLERYLTEQGFQVRSVANAEQMDRLLTRESFHLMVLDLMLPGEDGLSICRRLRSQSNPMPIIMVTAKGEEVDRIVGLEIGADDYIPKPFNPRELLARIRAVLRRQANELPGAPSQEEAVIAFGKFKLNLGTREMFREDEPMPLTSGEFAVLKALVSHPREPLSRDKLMKPRPRPRILCDGALHRRTDLPPAPHGGRGPGASALHPDRLGSGLRLRPGRF